VLETVPGVVALLLARHIDAAGETASGLVALVKELRATLADAMARAGDKRAEDDPLSRIRKARFGIVD